jgi:hypothetical protein
VVVLCLGSLLAGYQPASSSNDYKKQVMEEFAERIIRHFN